MNVARGLLHHGSGSGSSSSNHTCPSSNESGPSMPESQLLNTIWLLTSPAIVPLVGSMSFHTFSMILSGACGAFALVISLYLVFSHAMKYSTPVQQHQIIRIACLVPWVSIISFLSIWLETAGPYIAPALDFGAALALSAFLLLLCDYVLASRYGFNELFGDGALERGQYAGNSPPWLKVC